MPAVPSSESASSSGLVGADEDGGGELDAKRLNCDLVLIGGKRPGHCPEKPRLPVLSVIGTSIPSSAPV
jgi:hypothetical protein